MKTPSTRRGPARLRAVALAAAPPTGHEKSLARAIVLMQAVVLALCAARVGADWSRGSLGIEGGIALVLAGVFCLWLVTEVLRLTRRSRGGAKGLRLVHRIPS
jgi:hypothetical protein